MPEWRPSRGATVDRSIAMAQVSVFISYRRNGGFYLAKSIYDDLQEHGYDVFMDVRSLGAGEFEGITLDQIRARDYFVVVLTKGSLDRITNADDWLSLDPPMD
jgi:hypothetical protein